MKKQSAASGLQRFSVNGFIGFYTFSFLFLSFIIRPIGQKML
jgi:hypothetical protein